MTQRLIHLARLEAVQTRLVEFADLRLSAAERAYHALVEDQARLRDYIGQGESVGQPLAKAALKAIHDVNRRIVQAEVLIARQREHRNGMKRRARAATTMRETEAVVARRVAEDRDLREILESWLSRQAASLP